MAYRIGIDCRFYSKHTGIGRYIGELLSNLAKIDRTNSYYLFLNTATCPDFHIPAENFKIIHTTAKHYSFAEQTGFLKQINSHKLDLMHFTNFNAPLAYKRPYLVTIHDLTLHFFPGNKLNKPWHRLAYHLVFSQTVKHAKAIITVSSHTAKDLVTIYPSTKNKIVTIHLGINNDFLKDSYDSIEKKYTLPKQYLLYAGNWREHKNITNLLSAFKILKEKYNYPGHLVLTGEPQKDYPNLQKLLKTLQLSNVTLVGNIPSGDLPSLFHYAEAYVFPSFYEGFGLPALEAMQAGTPVVASNTASLPEVCGSAAIYFNPNSPTEIAQTINKVVSTPSLPSKLINLGKERVKSFSFYQMAKKTQQTYTEIINKNLL